MPCCFALTGIAEVSAGPAESADVIYWVVDAKPKSTLNLKRLDNVRATPSASLVVDHYDDDWTTLWWIRVDGSATVLDPGQESELARELLAAKYAQYRTSPPPGAVMRIDVTGWADWAAEV